MQNGTRKSNTAEETEHIRAYYTVLNNVLAIADIEKMYIPPLLHTHSKEGLFQNQMVYEKMLFETLNVGDAPHVLDIGCGRGRISHHFATWHPKSKVSGFNIDQN